MTLTQLRQKAKCNCGIRSNSTEAHYPDCPTLAIIAALKEVVAWHEERGAKSVFTEATSAHLKSAAHFTKWIEEMKRDTD